MDAGRELDTLIAEKVMGLLTTVGGDIYGEGEKTRYIRRSVDDSWETTPCYSTDIAAAVTVEQEIARQGREDAYADALLALKTESDYVMGDNWWLATAPPAARCRAALRAVGCEVPQ